MSYISQATGLLPVETGIPLPSDPPTLNTRGAKNIIPWLNMMPGDSTLVPEYLMTDRQARACVSRQNARTTKTFVAHPADGGTRIWRTS